MSSMYLDLMIHTSTRVSIIINSYIYISLVLCCYDKLSTDYARYCTYYVFLLTAAPLVKPIPFQPCDPSVAGPDIFQRLIPMEAHTDSSLYRSEVISLSTVVQLYFCQTSVQKNTKIKWCNMVNL